MQVMTSNVSQVWCEVGVWRVNAPNAPEFSEVSGILSSHMSPFARGLFIFLKMPSLLRSSMLSRRGCWNLRSTCKAPCSLLERGTS